MHYYEQAKQLEVSENVDSVLHPRLDRHLQQLQPLDDYLQDYTVVGVVFAQTSTILRACDKMGKDMDGQAIVAMGTIESATRWLKSKHPRQYSLLVSFVADIPCAVKVNVESPEDEICMLIHMLNSFPQIDTIFLPFVLEFTKWNYTSSGLHEAINDACNLSSHAETFTHMKELIEAHIKILNK
jgi:hypothetical protein